MLKRAFSAWKFLRVIFFFSIAQNKQIKDNFQFIHNIYISYIHFKYVYTLCKINDLLLIFKRELQSFSLIISLLEWETLTVQHKIYFTW